VTEILRFLHILTGAAWLGAALWVAGDVRRTLALGPPHLAGLAARVNPALGLDLWAGVATVLLGLVYMLWIGGHPGVGVMIGFTLALLRVAVTAAFVRPAWNKVAARIAAGEAVPATDPGARKLGMWSGIGHGLWLAILASMVF